MFKVLSPVSWIVVCLLMEWRCWASRTHWSPCQLQIICNESVSLQESRVRLWFREKRGRTVKEETCGSCVSTYRDREGVESSRVPDSSDWLFPPSCFLSVMISLPLLFHLQLSSCRAFPKTLSLMSLPPPRPLAGMSMWAEANSVEEREERETVIDLCRVQSSFPPDGYRGARGGDGRQDWDEQISKGWLVL